MNTIRAGLVGISGYAGMELARLLAVHPHIKLTMACSRAEAGKKLGDFYPFLRHLPGSEIEISVYDAEHAAKECDIVFLAVPAGTAMKMVPELLESDLRVVDFSADFRLRDPAIYEEWYRLPHTATKYIAEAVYGLPELYAAQIAKARLVANPGCYPTACILGLYAALKNNIIQAHGILIDAKSGASGAGRKAAIPNLFCEVEEDFRPYGVPAHRHTPEIEQEFSFAWAGNGNVGNISFVPHLVPMKRGILAAIYTKLKNHAAEDDIRNIFSKTWGKSPWIRVLPPACLPETANTRGSMFCDISVVVDARTDRLIVFSAIDNLCRGASGQALANANLMFDLPVNCGMENMAPLL